MSTDKHWQRWGKLDPYYAVATFQQFRRPLSAQAKAQFFESGERYVAHMLEVARRLDPGFAPHAALDFGCGTGRIAIPLAKHCAVTGIDISEDMLEETRANASERAVVVKLSREVIGGGYDLIHSHAVFQHIPKKRGMALTADLLGSLRTGGIAVLHYPYAYAGSLPRKLLHWVRIHVPLAHSAANALQGRIGEPPMQMNRYDLGALMRLFSGCRAVYAEHAISTPHIGIVFYVLK